jgi:cell division protein ZapA
MTTGDRGAEVEIFGERYMLRSSDSPDYLNRVADYVDRKFREVASEHPALVPSKIAVLASLNIADELFKQGDGYRRREGELLARVDGIVAALMREAIAP